jgi:penicillin-binding protein 1C
MIRRIISKKSLLFSICLIFLFSIYLDVKNDIKLSAPLPTQLIYDRNGYFLSESNPWDNNLLGYWNVTNPVPEKIKQALIYAEDRRFYSHFGVDPYALFRAVYQNLAGNPRQGASTIAMQVARMQRQTERTYWNKLCEMVIATGLILKYGHEAVLNHYLKLMPQGNRIHGITYSTRRYFRKPLMDLNWAEVTVLTALSKAPGRMNVFIDQGFEVAKSRAALILRRLKKHEIINNDQWQKAIYLLEKLYLPVKEERPYSSYHAILKLEDKIRQKQDQLKIHQPIATTIDLNIQDRVHQLAAKFLDYYRYLGAGNIGVMVVDLADKGILSYLGSLDYEDPNYSGSINYNDTPRSSGSILKPFVFALGLESKHYQTNSILMDGPMSIHSRNSMLAINNYDGLYLGPLIYRKALANSRNVPAVQIVESVGTANMMSVFKKLQLVDASASADYFGLGMAIGGIYVTLEKLINAYGTLANDGQLFQAQWFPGERGSGRSNQVIQRDVSRLVIQFLSDPQARLPSFPRLGNLEYPLPVAVKTGTSQGFRDAWTMAFSSNYLVGVWVGHPDNSPMKKVSGATVAVLVKQILLMLEKEFPLASSLNRFQIPDFYHKAKICASTGGRELEDCSEVISEFIHPNNQAIKIEQDQILIDTRTGNLANENTPSIALKVKRVSIEQPSEISIYDDRSPLKTGALITEPITGSRYVIDRSVPSNQQSIALRAKVKPLVPVLDWYIDGLKHFSSKPPHQIRWQLQPGIHYIQVRFPNAEIYSDIVKIEVGF